MLFQNNSSIYLHNRLICVLFLSVPVILTRYCLLSPFAFVIELRHVLVSLDVLDGILVTLHMIILMLTLFHLLAYMNVS